MCRRLASILSLAALALLAACSRTPTPSVKAASAAQLTEAAPPVQVTEVAPPAAAAPSGAPPVATPPSPFGSDVPVAGVTPPPAAVPPPAPPPAAVPDPVVTATPAAPPPSPAPAPTIGPPPAVAPPPTVVAISLPAGAPLAVRLDENVTTRRNRAGDSFDATLAAPVIIAGRTVLPAGTRFHGHITLSRTGGRFKGRAQLALTLDAFRLRGRHYRIRTDQVERESGNHRKRDEAAVGGGAGFGAAMGAIAGGPVGAAVGAIAGAGGGAVGAAVTGKKEVSLRAESLMHFRLESPVPL